MTLPRSKYVLEEQEGVYHCFSRCVRRAYLYGIDALTHRDFSHRKSWLVERLKYLAGIFAIDVCAYAVMENHYHTILRTRPDIVASWTDREVATRWLTLFPRRRGPRRTHTPPTEKEICVLADWPERIAQLRKRLCSLSWFMGRLNEYIARAANKEDKVKGRFWESRFKCQALLDEAAIAACMVYVDLNLIRAGLASTPEGSDFTSIQERIRAWQKETMTPGSLASEVHQGVQSASAATDTQLFENAGEMASPAPKPILTKGNSFGDPTLSSCWLCPIESDSQRRGILQMTTVDYFNLVDKSARMMRLDKRGVIDADLMPIMRRLGANPEEWIETISQFGSRFRLAAGLLCNLRHFAGQLGRQWLQGTAAARAAFESSPLQLD